MHMRRTLCDFATLRRLMSRNQSTLDSAPPSPYSAAHMTATALRFSFYYGYYS